MYQETIKIAIEAYCLRHYSVVPDTFMDNGEGDVTVSRMADLTEVGIKQQIGPLFANSKKLPGYLRNYNLAMIVGVTPPTGSRAISGTGTEGSLRFPWGKSIGKNWRAD